MSDIRPAIDPGHAILLVMDYQPGIINRLPHVDERLKRIAQVINDVRSKKVHVGYVRVAFDDADYDAIPASNERFQAMADARNMHNDAPETQIHDSTAPEPGDIVVRKTRVGAFSTTDLGQQLRDLQIDTLILAGLSTSGVVLSTVREAADRDYRIYVIEDACADSDQEVHDLLVQKIFPRQAHVIVAAELKQLLGVE
jgi:nicotinamidase-related amidase